MGPKRLNIGEDAATPTVSPTVTTVNVSPIASVFPNVSVPAVATVAQQSVVSAPNVPMTMDSISRVGGDAQSQLATVTQKITGVAKTSDMEGMGKLLTDTIMAAKGYDPNQLFKKGFFTGLFGKAQSLQMRFDTVDQTVVRLVGQVDQRVALFRGRVTDLVQLRDVTQKYHDDMTGQIVQLTQTADWMEQNQPVVDPADAMSASAVQEWLTVINFARKRADDLRRAQILAQQQVAQIDQLKTNSIALAQKFSDIKTTTIPALQNVFTAYVIAMEQKKGADLADMLDETTNQAIQQGAALMQQNTTQIHTALTRSNISMQSLQANHQSVLASLDEVKRLQAEMKTRIASETPQLEKLSQDLAQRLSQR